MLSLRAIDFTGFQRMQLCLLKMNCKFLYHISIRICMNKGMKTLKKKIKKS